MTNIDFGQMVTVNARREAETEAARLAAYAAVLQMIDRALPQDDAETPMVEKMAWAAKEAAAEAFLKDPTQESPILTAESSVTKEKVADLADQIVRNAAAYWQKIAIVTGLRRMARAELAAATTQKAMDLVVEHCAQRLAEMTVGWGDQAAG